jgi:DNA-binding CsgD family transcriptional regulator
MDNNEMLLFLASLPDTLDAMAKNKTDFVKYKDFVPRTDECYYVIDFSLNKIVYAKGFLNSMGYPDENIDLDLMINTMHPEDTELVNRVSKAAIMYAIEYPSSPENNILSITYRIRKNEGHYAKFLSQSVVLRTDENGSMLRTLVKLTNISFIDSSSHVFWEFKAKGLDKHKFKTQVYEPYQRFFTKREHEIISLLNKNLSNTDISMELSISIGTVATHRKNILKKSNCHNVADLIEFCLRRGIL